MAEIERFTNTASTPAGDGTTNEITGDNRAYASLNECEAAEQTDLDGAGNSFLVHWEGIAADTAAVAFNGWTTSVASPISVLVDSDKRHSGEWDTNKCRLSVDDTNNLFAIYEDYVNAEGLQIELINPTDTRTVVILAGQNVSNSINFTKCIMRGADDDSKNCIAFLCDDADAIVKFRNCLIYNAGHATSYGIKTTAGTYILENVTIANCWICIRGGGTWTEKNVLCDEVDTGNALYTWHADGTHTRTYCASNDDKADDQGGAGNQINQTFVYSSGYILDPADTGAKDLGTDLSGEGYSDDIAGNTRTGSWDIGCSEAQVGGTLLMMQANQLGNLGHRMTGGMQL